MSRKTLLTETEIRQFLKLANLGSVGDSRIQEMFGADELELSEEEEEEMEMDVELGAEEEPADDMDEPAEMEPEMDMGADMEAPAADAGGQMVSIDDFMGALESALEDALGEPVEVDMDDDAGEEPDDAEMDMDMGEPAGDMDMDMGADEEPGMRDMYESQDDLVNEVARRVAVRLQEKNNKQQVIDQLAERIMKRLTQ
tara:strand:- start:7683 stop:8279 length:597 start_codon:yes stop_codon:yes gene_type:complete